MSVRRAEQRFFVGACDIDGADRVSAARHLTCHRAGPDQLIESEAHARGPWRRDPAGGHIGWPDRFMGLLRVFCLGLIYAG